MKGIHPIAAACIFLNLPSTASGLKIYKTLKQVS